MVDSFTFFPLYVILKLCTEFQFPTMLATGQTICSVWWWWWRWLKPILVYSLAQAEQHLIEKFSVHKRFVHDSSSCWNEMIIEDDRLAWLDSARNNMRGKWTKHRIEWELSILFKRPFKR